MQQSHWNRSQELSGSQSDPQAYEQWLGFIARHTYTCSLEQRMQETGNFQFRARSRSVGGFTISRFVTTAGKCRLRRDAQGIADDSRDEYALFLLLRGDFEASQFGRVQAGGPGNYALLSASEPAVYSKGGGNDVICFLIPREFVDRRVVNGEQICVRPYAAGKGLNDLAFETVRAFQKNAWEITDDEFDKSARVVADLVLLALSGSADLSSGEHSVRAANLTRAKRIILRQLGNPDFTLADLGEESGLSLRYLHNLFRDEGCTIWEFLKNARLQRARELLEFSSRNEVSVTDVCLQCGFSSMSYFSTAFKRAFGTSPRSISRNG